MGIAKLLLLFWDSRFFVLNKKFKRIGCAKDRLLKTDNVEMTSDRSSCLQMLLKTGDLKNSTIERKHLCLSLFLIKFALKFSIKKKLQRRYFPVNIAKFLRSAFVIEHRWMLSTFDPIIYSDWLTKSLRSHQVLCLKHVLLL